jgi:CHAT domain-containing protein
MAGTKDPKERTRRGKTSSDERGEALWSDLLELAGELSLSFSPATDDALREVLRKGLEALDRSGGPPWVEARPVLVAALRRLLEELAARARGRSRAIQVGVFERVLARLVGTWTGLAARFFGVTLAKGRISFGSDPGTVYVSKSDKKNPWDLVAETYAAPGKGTMSVRWGPEEEAREELEPTRGGRARERPKEAAKEEAPPAPAPEPDPPRTAYARLDAPEVVVAGLEFAIEVGLAEKPSPGVLSERMERPASSVGPYDLSLHLVADGFRLREGERLRRTLLVTAAKPYPTATFHLTAEPQEEPIRARALQAFYEVGGQTMGMAVRPVSVVRSAALVAHAEKPEKPASPPGVDLAIPTEASAPDLEVRILVDPDHASRLLWTFTTPHKGIDLPEEPLTTDIGNDPKSFTRLLVDKVNAKEGKTGIYPLLAGIGRTIADQVPDQLQDLLRAVAGRSRGVPSVLLLSQEPYVPWELAKLDEPLLDPSAPPFLAAQVNVGRWVLPRQEKESTRQRPRQPPPIEQAVRSVAVVSGVYDLPGWNRLREAEGEAADLDQSLGAAKVDASSEKVFECLEGDPPADLLHFAVHGIYDPNGVQDGLMLIDGETLDPLQVEGLDLGRAPFVFLNACQVGAGNQILGDSAGMAAAFLAAGASGVVAPLWSVKDTLARQIAKDFYAATKAGTASPAAALRQARKGFQAEAKPQSATWLAYQFFGHPALKLHFES